MEEFYTPQWVRDAVFYHIFPERFANGDPSNDPPGAVPWGSEPTFDNFMGGDLQGVLDRIDYFTDLGVTALYFNPIFEARSNHKFDHGDYLKIDPHFGTNELMKELVRELHANGIRIILDISHNHSGREFFAFADVVKRGEESPYKDWYTFHGFPVSGPEEPNYNAWWGFGTLPEFRHDNPEVRKYFWEVTRYWMEEVGIDGWRLDVANEVPHDYWAEWRELVKRINPEAYTVGEIWGDGSPWLQGDNFDAVMNYLWRDLVVDFTAEESSPPSGYHDGVQELLGRYPPPVIPVMFNLMGSHDTPRFLTVAQGDIDRLKLAFLLQMTYVGAPVIYYGDEIGMVGGKDPDCRRAFPWDQDDWNHELRQYVKRLIEVRRSEPSLRSVDYTAALVDDERQIYAYCRGKGASAVYVALNRAHESRRFTLPVLEWDGAIGAIDLINQKDLSVSAEGVPLDLKARSGIIIKARL